MVNMSVLEEVKDFKDSDSYYYRYTYNVRFNNYEDEELKYCYFSLN